MYVIKYDVHGFLREWFNEKLGGREILVNSNQVIKEIGIKTPREKSFRYYITNHRELITYVINSNKKMLPSYMSVQPFKARDKPIYIEKIFLDFDDENDPETAIREACKIRKLIRKYYNAESLTFFSGHKGAHLYIFLKDPVVIDDPNLYSLIYKELINKILLGLNIKTKDSVVFELKRLARVPYSIHNKTGRVCLYIDQDGIKKYYTPDLDQYKENGLDPEVLHQIHHEILNKKGSVTRRNNFISVSKSRGRWREVNGVTYNVCLDGYGWIQQIISKHIYFNDGRDTFIWYVLSKAVAQGLVSEVEAIEWIRGCITKYPDPKKSVDHYITKLRSNEKSGINPPTWKTILSPGPGKRVEDINRLKRVLIPALAEAGLIKRGDSDG